MGVRRRGRCGKQICDRFISYYIWQLFLLSIITLGPCYKSVRECDTSSNKWEALGKDFLNLKMNRRFSNVDVTLKLALIERNSMEGEKNVKNLEFWQFYSCMKLTIFRIARLLKLFFVTQIYWVFKPIWIKFFFFFNYDYSLLLKAY